MNSSTTEAEAVAKEELESQNGTEHTDGRWRETAIY